MEYQVVGVEFMDHVSFGGKGSGFVLRVGTGDWIAGVGSGAS